MEMQPTSDNTQADQHATIYQAPALIDYGSIEALTQQGEITEGAADALAVSKNVF